MSTAPAGRDDAVAAGRGFLLIAASKVYFILTSAVIALGLPRLFGDPGRFGEYRVVMGLATILNMVLITGALQAVSRLVSESPRSPRAMLRGGLWAAGAIGGVTAGTLAAAATPIAGLVFQDETLGPYVRLSAVVVFLYAVYGVVVGGFNGARRFREQAGLDMVFSTLKVVCILAGVALGFGIAGGIGGFSLATAVTLAIGIAAVWGPPDVDQAPAGTARRALVLLLPLLGTQIMLNALIQLDGIAVKAFLNSPIASADTATLSALARDIGLTTIPIDATKVLTDRLAGLFGAAKNLALIPYQATFALTLVVFPLVSSAVSGADPERARSTTKGALRFAFLLGSLLAAALAGASAPSLGLLFGAEYRVASSALRVLLAAGVLLAALVLVGTLLNAARRETAALLTTFGTAVLTAAILFGLLHGPEGATIAALERAAWATLTAATAGLCVSLYFLSRALPGGVPWLSFVRIGGAASAGALLGMLVPLDGGSVGSLLVAVAVRGTVSLVTAIALLLLTRELTRADIDAVRRITRRKQ